MSDVTEYVVSASGQMSVPAAVRHRWGLDDGGKVTVLDLGEAVVLLPSGARQRLLDRALPSEEHLRLVRKAVEGDGSAS